jgi:hypothetical protein
MKGFAVLLPPVSTFNTAVSFSAVSSVTVTPGSTPVVGQLMLIVLCANPTGTYTVTPPVGWTEVTFNSGVNRIMKIYYKVATGSEPASYGFTLGVNCVGHWRIYYMNNIAPPLVVPNDSFGDGFPTGGAPIPVTNGPYQIYNYSFVIIQAVPNSPGATNINCDNSFLHGTTGHSGSSKIWVRVYDVTARNEVTNMISPTVGILLPRFTVINANRMY